MRQYEDRDPEQLLPAELPNVLLFEPNKEYVRDVLATQMDLTTLGTGFVQDQHERFVQFQRQLRRWTSGFRHRHRPAPGAV